MILVTREEWGARHGVGAVRAHTARARVVVHHSGEEYDYDPGDAEAWAALVRRIERYHVEKRDRIGISYSHLIDPYGRVYVGRGHNVGAHTPGLNATSYGVCFLGDFTKEVPTAEALAAFRVLVAHLVEEGHLTGGAVVSGHRDHRATDCPGWALHGILHTLQP